MASDAILEEYGYLEYIISFKEDKMKRNALIGILLVLILFLATGWPSVVGGTSLENLIANADFSGGMQGWWLGQQEGGKATMAAEDGILSAKIDSPGKWPWSVMVGHSDINVEKNMVYEVSFEARSREIRRIESQMAMANAPYYSYSGKHIFTLESEFHKYSFPFTMRQATDNKAIFQIFLGRMGKGVVEITNVRIIRTGQKKVDVIPNDFPKPFAVQIKRGITFGNTLDAPQEGAWAPELREEYFEIIKSAGIFDHIRIPTRWNTHALKEAPYTIDPEYMQRVDWAVSQALKRGFYVVLNMHYFDELAANPPKNKDEFIALWSQIAEHFKDYPDNLYLEIYNEPQRELDSYWNRYYPEAYDVIRQSNPTRKIVISCPGWANVTTLNQLKLPQNIKNDPNILVQFHFYYPIEFCMQGNIGSGLEDVSGHRWKGTAAQKKELTRLADNAVEWAKRNGGVSLWNGEFCAQPGSSLEEDRLQWTAFIIKLCEDRNIPWAYWDFTGDYSKIYDFETGLWNEPILKVMKNGE